MYQFDPYIAQHYGVDEAIMFQNIVFRCTKNKANGNNFFDGKYRTYNSRKAYAELFPFWSEDQVKRILERSIKKWLLLKWCYNANTYDRTAWYTPVDQSALCIGRNRPMERTESPNLPIADKKPEQKPEDFAEWGKPPEDKKPEKPKQDFINFWKEYPRKEKKRPAEIKYKTLITTWVVTHEIMMKWLQNYRDHIKKKWLEMKYVKHCITRLNNYCWDDEYEHQGKAKSDQIPKKVKTVTTQSIIDESAKQGNKLSPEEAEKVKNRLAEAKQKVLSNTTKVNDQIKEKDKQHQKNNLPPADQWA